MDLSYRGVRRGGFGGVRRGGLEESFPRHQGTRQPSENQTGADNAPLFQRPADRANYRHDQKRGRGRGTGSRGRGDFKDSEGRGRADFDHMNRSRDTIQTEGGAGFSHGAWSNISQVFDRQNTLHPQRRGRSEQAEGPAEGDKGSYPMTLDEWRVMNRGPTNKDFNLRKAGEGVDPSQWKEGVVYTKGPKEEKKNRGKPKKERPNSSHNTLTIPVAFNGRVNCGEGSRPHMGPTTLGRGCLGVGLPGARRGGREGGEGTQTEPSYRRRVRAPPLNCAEFPCLSRGAPEDSTSPQLDERAEALRLAGLLAKAPEPRP